MNSEHTNNEFEGGKSQPQEIESILDVPVYSSEKKPKKHTGWKIFWGIFTGLSVLANFMLFLFLIAMLVFVAAGRKVGLYEQIVEDGPATNKIAIISIEGVINNETSKQFRDQIKAAAKDRHVKGIIVKTNSPGGGISSSDEIHNEIIKYRKQTGKPAIAFMEGLAASGGYYTSVACDKIIAEPTTITGSIGVILGYLVMQELLEGKLGIQPVIVKSGLKKDWPSSFQPPTEEQLQYLRDKIITPAYERFVQIIADGRESLNLADVKRLADGSIYPAQEALDEKLIDDIGYLDKAIEEVKMLAGIEKARVVEYQKPFSLPALLSAQAEKQLKFDRLSLHELARPQALYLWDGY